ncbi:DUF2304 family protein [archaeon]|jgi:small membrane protein|nr:DUF2304 family protein [archaeon]MBT3451159.1 DUF2304 family protein [archaeon]MBT6869310.1 DUF2304 family protein [archaeon]MBT7192473.1 DUF2304 family protein [archaeon]MBT7380549.1 DUF2304 family protein [archaeon]
MEIIQYLIFIFGIFAISRSILRLKSKSISKLEFLFWLGIWLTVIILGLLPNFTTFFSSILGIERGVDAIIYVSIIALFYLLFRLYVKVDEINLEITKLVRELAKKRK